MDTRISNALPVTSTNVALICLYLALAASLVLSLATAAGAAGAIKTEVVVGKSAILTLPGPVSRVSLTAPEVADVVVISPRELQLNGKEIGSTSLIVWDKAGVKTFFDIDVIIDHSQLRDRLAEIAPGDELSVKVARGSVIVSGTVSTPDRLIRVSEILKNYQAEGLKVVNLVEIGEMPQVLLQITVASIDRKATRELGINWGYFGKDLNFISSVTSGLPIDTITGLVNSTELGGNELAFGNRPNFGVIDWNHGTAYMVRALAGKGLAKILAEPNLLVKSGSTGTFLAGGEFPYPVVQSSQAGETAALTVVFKEYGIRMNFRPMVRESGVIEIAMGRPPQKTTLIASENLLTSSYDTGEKGIEVSSLDYANSVTIQGTTIPGLKKDAVSTNIDLKEGESFVIAGLINEEWSKNLNKFPLLGDIPILGAFFRDQTMTKNERELIFIVTPKVMKPMKPGERAVIPGADEPTMRQEEDLRWIPMLPNYRSVDPEQLQ